MGRFSLIIGILFWKEKGMISDLLSDGVSDENLKGWGESLCVGSIYWEFVDFGVLFFFFGTIVYCRMNTILGKYDHETNVGSSSCD